MSDGRVGLELLNCSEQFVEIVRHLCPTMPRLLFKLFWGVGCDLRYFLLLSV